MTVDVAPAERATAPRATSNRSTRERLSVALVALGAGLVVLVSVSQGWLPGFVSLGLLVVLLATVPTAPDLTSRLALNLAVLIGLAPVLWWVPWPVRVNHGALLLGVGTVVAVALSRPGTLGPLLPRSVRCTVWLVATGGLVAAWATHRLWTSSPRQALLVLLPGGDNWAHFTMFATLQRLGVVPRVTQTGPDGSAWGFGSYPKGFHALAATLSEVMHPGLRSGPELLVAYSQAIVVVVVLAAMLVVAAILTVPAISGRPWVAAPTVAVSLTGLLWEPGQKVLANGFANFWLAAVAAGCALLLALSLRPRSAVTALGVCSLLVCAAHTWIPLALIAAPAGLLMLRSGSADASRRRRTSRWSWAVLVLCGLLALRAAVDVVSTVSVGQIVTAQSGYDGTSVLPTLLLLVLLLFLAVSWRGVVTAAGTRFDLPSAASLRTVTLGPVLGIVALTALLVLQLREVGTSSYYFLKFLVGFELVLVVLVPALVACALATVATRTPHGAGAVVLSVVGCLAATQLYGHVPVHRALLMGAGDDGTIGLDDHYDRGAIVDGILAAARATPRDAVDRDYLALGAGNTPLVYYPDAWFHALTASTTSAVVERMADLQVHVTSPAEARVPVQRLLDGNPGVRVLVPADQLAALSAVDQPEAGRLTRLDAPGRGR